VSQFRDRVCCCVSVFVNGRTVNETVDIASYSIVPYESRFLAGLASILRA
jgi:hypothetical protein